MEAHISVPLFSISTHLRFSLESGCKITALQHIRQMLHPTFFKVSANFLLTRWFVDVFFSRVFPPLFKGALCYTLILLRARVSTLILSRQGNDSSFFSTFPTFYTKRLAFNTLAMQKACREHVGNFFSSKRLHDYVLYSIGSHGFPLWAVLL